MGKLKETLFTINPRENSGSTSSNRFDYQKDWVICKILELHEKPEDYLISLEHHDDIIIFDSSSDPQKISFYQVKTNKEPHWLLSKLIARKKGKNGLLNSALGKLYLHLENYGELVQSLNFVTNSKIRGKLKNNNKCEDTAGFSCNDLEKEELDKIIKGLKAEHSLSALKEFEKITFFKLGELNIDQHSTITRGLLGDFIDRNLPHVRYQIAPLYRSIFDEIKMKADFEKTILSFEELKAKKSISRAEFDSYLKTLQNTNDQEKQRLAIENRLNIEGIGFNEIKNFKTASKAYEVRRMTYNDKDLIRIEKEIGKIIQDKNPNLNNGLFNSMNEIFSVVEKEVHYSVSFDKELIKAIIIHKLYE